nr:LOW QUALITY PROTEIN: tyrosine-protein kinase ITK/TSK [Salvelinus alpinus]
MLPTVILKGTLIKKSQQKRRTSPCNYKERLFVLDTQDLTYSEQRPGKKPSQKGCIELSRIKCVEIVCSEVPIPCSNKYPFQVVHDNCYLYIFAPDNDCRQRWVRALKEETKCNALLLKYHPNFWMEGRWRCCYQTEKMATGCQEYDPMGYASKKPLPPTPDPQRRLSDPGQRVVVALQNYSPHEDTDLPLHKDQEYILTDSSHHDWWTVQDHRGNSGFVPCMYIAEKSCDNFNRFEWYNKEITRGRAEELLMTEGKEGAFMVRDSRHAGVYTVSVFTKAPGSNGQKNPRVKHYQIRQSEAEESKFYLAEKYLFSTIPELIQYHQHNAAGLITRLRDPVSQGREALRALRNSRSEVDLLLLSPGASSNFVWLLIMEGIIEIVRGLIFASVPLVSGVDPAELTLGEEVGRGQFGLVLQGRWRERRVAVKMVRKGAMSEEDFQRGGQVMTMLSHCKLVQLYGVCTQHSPMCLVFELMEQGCLSDYLRARRGRMSQDSLLGMCLDVSEGMAYLESNNFIHRDLAARNCLVSCNNVVKVSDFGMTRFVLDDQYTSSQGSKFPIKWSSPEVIKYCKFSSKSDVWSLWIDLFILSESCVL